ncbi:MAG: sulfite oxidase heme-binding subunit YedZ [Acidobacteriaceae bacterium]
MSNRAIVALKVPVHIACLVPLAILGFDVWRSTLGPDPTATIAHGTGFAALRILVISLAITPVRRLSVKLAWMIRFRRMLGLYAFFYVCLHLLVYLKLYANFDWATIVDDLTKRRYIIVGFTAWLLLLPLALTSTKWSIRKLGKRWQRLHRLAYLAAIAGVIHYWWIVKTGVLSPVKITIVLTLLLAARPVWMLVDARRRQARSRPARVNA